MSNTTPLEAGGVGIALPRGWEGEIFNRAPVVDGRSLQAPGAANPDEVARNVIHVANFALPAERGDFGSGAAGRDFAETHDIGTISYLQRLVGVLFHQQHGQSSCFAVC